MSAIELLYQAAAEKTVARVLIINAHADPWLLKLSEQCEQLDLYQHFKPEYTAIHHLGLHASKVLSDFYLYDCVLLLPSKNKQQTLGWMAEAMQYLREDGTLLMACANTHGAKSYELALKELAGNITSRSKSKCRIFSANKRTLMDNILLKKWLDNAQSKPITSTHHLMSRPGLFSWDHADAGSQLLLEHLPHDFSGTGMDLCCGYGFLAEHLLRTSSHIETLHLLEADRLALDCAVQNTAAWQHKTHIHWLDAASDVLPQSLDWIVCNPPFHTGQQRDVTLGQNIVKRACQSLKRGGTLYVVANRKLAYENLMRDELKHCQTLIEADGFKVIQGVR